MEGIQAPTAAGPEQFELLSLSFLDYKGTVYTVS